MLREARKSKHYTQSQLALLLSISQSYSSKIEQNSPEIIGSIPLELFLRISKVLNICPIDLFSTSSYIKDSCCSKCENYSYYLINNHK